MRKRNVHIQFWLDKKEAEAFQKKVKKSGLSREAYLRHLVNGLEPQDAPPPDYYAMMLEGLTRDNRHQKLLDSLINQLIALLQRDSSRAFIARGIVHWLETEHPLKARLLPTEWLGEHSAEMVTDAVNTLLDEVTHDRTHQIRQTFDRATQKLIDNLKSDPELAQKADNIKAWL